MTSRRLEIRLQDFGHASHGNPHGVGVHPISRRRRDLGNKPASKKRKPARLDEMVCKQHLNEFNFIIIDLNNIDIKMIMRIIH